MRKKSVICYEGVFVQKKNNFAFVNTNVPGVDSFYIHKKYFNGALANDIVKIKVINRYRKEAKVVSIIKRHQQNLVVLLVKKRKHWQAVCYGLGEPRIVNFTAPKELVYINNEFYSAQIISYNPLKLILLQSIGNLCDLDGDLIPILAKYQVLELIPNLSVLEQVNNIDETVVLTSDRLDLTDDVIFTIDNDDTKDIDDAISIKRTDKGYCLGVHIADVSHYVKWNDALDIVAREKGSSIYYLDKVIPMLPPKLSNGICSLNPSVLRYARSVFINYDFEGNIIDFNYHKSVIKSVAQCCYSQVNNYFEQQDNNLFDIIKPSLDLMKELAILIDKRTKAEGRLYFNSREVKVVLDDKRNVLNIDLKPDGFSQHLIELFMVEANQCIAQLLDESFRIGIYRHHQAVDDSEIRKLIPQLEMIDSSLKLNSDSTMQDILEQTDNRLVADLLLKAMPKAIYSREYSFHYGLGLDYYTHFTSPIRRYPDLMVHRLIDNQQFLLSEIDQVLDMSNYGEKRAMDVERDIVKYKKAQYMQDKIGMEFVGTIISLMPYGIFVELDNFVEGMIPIRSFDQECAFQLGQRVIVVVDSVSLMNSEVTFEFKEVIEHE